jgi:ATP-dependent DNA helicase RecQ
MYSNSSVADVQQQLGEIGIQRGPLVRDSLSLQTLRLPDQAARLAWLAKRIPELPGTGIVYVLTIRDAEQVAAWLSSQGIAARAYFGSVAHDDFPDSNTYRQHLEEQLLGNQVKALVATTALGMGYDKPDLGFVIHYQAPSSVVSYYQHVGRAGRALDHAVGVLLSGREDDDIHEYFRGTAFPPERDVVAILNALDESEGMSIVELQRHLNLRQNQIDKVLKILSVENPAPIIKLGTKWQRTPVPFEMDRDRIEHLTHQRELEWQQIQEYIETKDCLMAFLRKSEFPFKPKKQVAAGAFPEYEFRGNLPPDLQASEGRILSRWGDSGWGALVAVDKHAGHFRDELVEAMAEMVERRWLPNPQPQWVTCVPSLNHPTLVPTFAARLAARLRLPFHEVIQKVRDNEPQKNQQNRFHQCRNLDGAFALTDNINRTPVLLVDDVIDSGWTVTVLAALLRRSGSGPVYPVALASTSTGD